MKDDQKDQNSREVGKLHRAVQRAETRPTPELSAAPSFTPGPWRADLGPVNAYVLDANHRVIATAESLLDGVDNASREAETKANARLIAAAPALYAELVKARDTFNDFIIPLRIMRRGLMADACEIARDSMIAALALATKPATSEQKG